MMRLILASLYIFLLATPDGGAPRASPPPPPLPPPSPNTPIAFHRIVMMWPKAYCHINKCIKTPPGTFTMHGVWPSFPNGESKINCPVKEPFSSSIISLIEDKMKSCWPSYVQANDRFWGHEWVTHGSCADMCIVPGPKKTYVPKAYYDALVSYFKFTPQLTCKEKVGDKNKDKYLYEVVFCVDLKFNPINCPRDKYLSGCGPIGGGGPTKTPIYFI
ncbi:hypothetical protein KSS87_007173 [Heliosperma pusillum]|nr:hypothetical protein KSS87_007173 [Heliosperma pusillum]